MLKAIALPCLFAVPMFAADAQATFQKTLEVLGFAKAGAKILHCREMQGIEQDYQSAAPFITIFQTRETWFDAASGVERAETQMLGPGNGPGRAVTTFQDPQRYLNVWAMLVDWRTSGNLRMAPDQMFQDYTRTVLVRTGRYGDEKLFVDTKTGFPVKLDREEPHYLWGQVHVEYIYTLWTDLDGVQIAPVSARVVDGFKEITRTYGSIEWIEREKAPALTPPESKGTPDQVPLFLQPLPVKKTEVGAQTFLTSNVGYTEAFTLIDGTIYVLDATQGEERAKQDLDLLRQTFPGEHPVVLVVTDLAWPHIAGMRFWVAQGATVVSHRASKDLLTRVFERRWTRRPDLLEQRRASVKFKFVAMDQEYRTPGGKLQIFAIDGIGSEGALMVYLPADRFLWASDYIQTTRRPSAYTTEVWQAVKRTGVAPERVAAQHIPITAWSVIEGLASARK